MLRHLHRADQSRRPHGRAAAERGETLVEVMFTVVLMGTGFVAIISSIFTSTHISDSNNQRTKASLAVQAYAESLQQPAIDPPASPPGSYIPQDSSTYQPCAAPAAYEGPTISGGGLPKGYKATITKIRYLTGYVGGKPVFTAAGLSQGDATNQCYASLYTSASIELENGTVRTVYYDRGLQEVTVRLDSEARPRERVIDTLVVVKRDQRCPTTYDNADLGPC